ncbi:MAG TPA: S53 family peptidase [Amnibacterium sp.]|nr:S53 family peptidase [Amnibacterium sp.]
MLTLTAGVAAALAIAGPATAAPASGPVSSTVPSGVQAAHLTGATVFGDTPGGTQEQVSFILKIRNAAELKSQVERGTGGGLSTARFADRYGQPRRVVAAVQAYLKHFGITSTAMADRLDIQARGTAGQFDAALSVHQKQYRVPAVKSKDGGSGLPAQTVHSNVEQPRMPRDQAGPILAVLGLTNYSSNVTHVTKKSTKVAQRSGTASDTCTAITGLASDCNTPLDFAKRYGVKGLYAKGAVGAGRTVGIITLAGYDTGSAEYFWSQQLHLPSGRRHVTTIDVDGGPGAPSDASGTGETDLDVQQAGGVAPGANVRVYQAPNSDTGFADAFFQAASDNIADSVSASWGESEAVIRVAVASGAQTPAYAAVFDEAFLEFAAQKQSAFVASGDAAAYDDSNELGSTALVVDNPGGSPFVTDAGGTTLPVSLTLSGTGGTATATVSHERAWGWDYLWKPIATASGAPLARTAESLVVGGGGGFSWFSPQPAYQRGVAGTRVYDAVPYLTPTAPKDFGGVTEPSAWIFDPHPRVITGTGSGRAVPDLSANADPETGYLYYEPSAVASGLPALGSAGGTSFVAPQLNGAAAVLASALGHRAGFLNPALYRLASERTGALHPLNTPGTSNDNVFYTGRPGTVFNPATGLGTPDFTAIAAGLGRER